MPIFEFQCTNCKHLFEDITEHNSKLPPCPQCSSLHTERVLSAHNVQTSSTAQFVPPCGQKKCSSRGFS